MPRFGVVDVSSNNSGGATIGEVGAVVGAEAKADVRVMSKANFWDAANVSREAAPFFRKLPEVGEDSWLFQ